MTNEDKILSLLSQMQTNLTKMQTDLNKLGTDVAEMRTDIAEMRTDIAEIKETQADHTICLNALVEWADSCREVDRLPLPKL